MSSASTTRRGETPDVTIVEAEHRSAAGLLISPLGTPYRISVGPNTAPADSSAQQREIGGHLVEFATDDAFNRYTLHTDCVAVGITQPSEAAAGSDDEIDELLDQLVNFVAVTIALPDGWQSSGAGSPGRLLQITYDYRFGDGVHTVTLAQAIDTPIAALQGITLAPDADRLRELPYEVVLIDRVLDRLPERS